MLKTEEMTGARFCKLFCLIVLIVGEIHSDSPPDGANVAGHNEGKIRPRRSCQDPKFVSQFISLVEKLENHVKKDIEDIANSIRGRGYGGRIFNHVSGSFFGSAPDKIPDNVFTKSELDLLDNMMRHSFNNTSSVETGVSFHKNGQTTIAMGHVITGICAGLARDRNLFWLKQYTGATGDIDNLFLMTIAGDLGQSALLYDSKLAPALLGPTGSWDSSSCPTKYTTTTAAASEATDAELIGDLDGFIIGSKLETLWKSLRLSEVLRQYYGSGQGIGGDPLYTYSKRVTTFYNLVSKTDLIKQTRSFAEAYTKGRNDITTKKRYIPLITNKIVYQFFKYKFMCRPHTLQTMIKLITKVEQKLKADCRTMCSYLRSLVDDNVCSKASWFRIVGSPLVFPRNVLIKTEESLLKVLIDHNIKRKVESGVVVDKNGNTIAISRVVAGIEAGTTKRKKASSYNYNLLLAVTVGGELCHAMRRKLERSKPLFGKKGKWDDASCPEEYKYRHQVPEATIPELYGAIDGFIIGSKIEEILKRDHLKKLSDIFTEYYGSGLSFDRTVRGDNRKTLFKSLMPKTDLVKQLKSICNQCDESGTSLDHIINDMVNEFYEKVLATSTGASGAISASSVIPDFLILRKYYPAGQFDTNAVLGRTSGTASTDVIRLSHMFNQLPSFLIKPTEKNAVRGSNAQLGYFIRLEHIKEYLKKRFGKPIVTRNTATLKSKVGTKGGVMVVDIDLPGGSKGVAGLWDGSKMYHVTDYTSDSRLKNINFWPSTGCGDLADKGDCSYYLCVENEFKCGKKGYALGYGHRYCNKFSEKYNKFNAQGQQWIDGVRKCLMKELQKFLEYPGKTCYNVKEFAFKSHPDCYVNSPPGFCKIWSTNKAALWSVFEIKDFVGVDKDAQYAWQQVADVAKSCISAGASSVKQELDAMVDRARQWFGSSKIKSKAVIDSDCVGYAASGDCRFYECLEERFPCAKEGYEHIREFEFPSCQKFDRLSPWMSSQGRSWLKGTHRCLSQSLLPLYRSDSLSCSDIRELMTGNKVKCMVDSGFCSLAEKDAFPIDRAMDIKSFPLMMKQDFETGTAKLKTVTLGLGYYRALLGFRRQIGDAHAECHNQNLKSSNTLYTEYDSIKYNTKLKKINK